MTSRAASRTSPTGFDTGHEARGPTSRPQELRRHRSVSLRSPGGAADKQRPTCLGARQQAVKRAEPGCGHRSGSCPPWRQTDHIRLNARIGRMMSAQTTIEENRPSGFSIGAGGGSTRAERCGDQNQDQLAPRSFVPRRSRPSIACAQHDRGSPGARRSEIHESRAHSLAVRTMPINLSNRIGEAARTTICGRTNRLRMVTSP